MIIQILIRMEEAISLIMPIPINQEIKEITIKIVIATQIIFLIMMEDPQIYSITTTIPIK